MTLKQNIECLGFLREFGLDYLREARVVQRSEHPPGTPAARGQYPGMAGMVFGIKI